MGKQISYCEYCGKVIEDYRVRRFCSRTCQALQLKPSQHLLIEDGSQMSERTTYRRKRAAGLTQPVFRYPFNEHFFDKWSDGMAWVLGLIWSDGCLFNNSVEICSIDYEMLQLVEGLIEMPNGIRPKNKGNAWRIVFTSSHARERLEQLGLTKAKSFTVTFPDIPREFQGAFVRGLLDGDGSVHESFRRKGQQEIDIQVEWVGASPYLRDGLLAWLDANNIYARHGISHTTVWRITVQRHDDLRRLYDLLYPSEDVCCLLRKRVPYHAWLITPRARTGRPKGQVDQIVE